MRVEEAWFPAYPRANKKETRQQQANNTVARDHLERGAVTVDMRDIFRKQLEFSGTSLLKATEDLTDEEAAHRPHDLAPIVWQVGHIAYYDAVLLSKVHGGEPDVPAEYAQLFKQGSSGEGDFPPLSEVRATFQRVHEEILKLAELELDRELEGGPLSSTLAGALMFNNMHRGWHNGKIMTLRALLGKPVMF